MLRLPQLSVLEIGLSSAIHGHLAHRQAQLVLARLSGYAVSWWVFVYRGSKARRLKRALHTVS